MKMAKRKVTRKTGSIACMTLSELIVRAESLIEANPGLTLDDFSVEMSYGYGDSVNSVLEYETLETGEEFHKRCEQDRLYKESRRKQYEALKKEFEGGKA